MSALDHLKDMLSGAAEKGVGKGTAAPASFLPVDALAPGSFQPRRHFDPQELQELADSIREKGILQPLLVRVTEQGHEIVAGERRWRAAQLAGLREVPVYIRSVNDQDARLFGLMENLQRSDLSPFDEIEGKLAAAGAVLGLAPEQAKTRLNELLRHPDPETVATLNTLFRQLGRENWESYARNKLRVFGWPAPVLQAMREGLPFTVAGIVAAAPAGLQAELLTHAQRGASRQELKELIQRRQKPRPKLSTPEDRAISALKNRRKLATLSPEKMERVQVLLAELLKELEDR